MGILSKPLWVILGALALALAVSAAGVLYFRGEARTLRAELNAVQADLKGLESAYSDLEVRVKARAAVDVAQSNTRAKKAQAVRAVRVAGSLKPRTQVFVPPASCLERPAEVPEPQRDLYVYVQDLIVLYSDSAVLREQCRGALIKDMK